MQNENTESGLVSQSNGQKAGYRCLLQEIDTYPIMTKQLRAFKRFGPDFIVGPCERFPEPKRLV